MIHVHFAPSFQRHVACPSAVVVGRTVHESLEAVFVANSQARGYVLDEQGALRPHVVIFIDGRPIRDREELSDPVPDGAELHIFQALSGG